MTEAPRKNMFLKGVRDGVPIALGYYAVAFALGIQAKNAGILWFEGAIASFLTHASAGEYAGIQVISENGSVLNFMGALSMVLVTLVASARYFLMSAALSQRVSPDLSLDRRALVAFGITDEIFGAEIALSGTVPPSYAYGLFVLPFIGWPAGTATGILLGSVLPAFIVEALSVALYGMFLAIIVPPARKNKVVALGVILSFALSFAFSRIPWISALPEGIRTVILTLAIAGLLALLFPVGEEKLAAQDGREEEQHA